MTVSTTTALERYQPVLTELEQTALLGFLAGYHGFTRARRTPWICASSPPGAGNMTSASLMSVASTSSASVATSKTAARPVPPSPAGGARWSASTRYAEEEGVIDHSPAVHVRRPRIDYESHVAHLDRNELGAILATAGLSSPRDHALVSVLALNGLRVSEAPTSTPSVWSVAIARSPWSARAARPPPCRWRHASPGLST
jgi:integrase/recombinase XerD